MLPSAPRRPELAMARHTTGSRLQRLPGLRASLGPGTTAVVAASRGNLVWMRRRLPMPSAGTRPGTGRGCRRRATRSASMMRLLAGWPGPIPQEPVLGAFEESLLGVELCRPSNESSTGASPLGVHGREPLAGRRLLSGGARGGWPRSWRAWPASTSHANHLCSVRHWSGRAQCQSGSPRARGPGLGPMPIT